MSARDPTHIFVSVFPSILTAIVLVRRMGRLYFLLTNGSSHHTVTLYVVAGGTSANDHHVTIFAQTGKYRRSESAYVGRGPALIWTPPGRHLRLHSTNRLRANWQTVVFKIFNDLGCAFLSSISVTVAI